MREPFDAIVIGGGPAGALAGLLLTRQGWRIAIVERRPRHRSKTCGHCLSPRALPILREVELLDAVQKVSAGDTHVLRVHAGRARIELEMGDDQGLLVNRGTFDQLLLDRAAAAGAEVSQPVARASGLCVTTLAQARRLCHHRGLILGADGLGSGVARAFGAAPPNAGRKYGFSFDMAGMLNQQDVINMYVIDGGYLGVVQQCNETLHCAGLIGTNDRLPRDPIAFCRALAMQYTELQHLSLHRITRSDVRNLVAAGPMPWRPRKIAGEGFALLGDAAGYVEPFTGEGMCWALQSAQALAEVVSDVPPGAWNERLAAQYAALWRERIGRDQRRCAAIAWALERPWALAAVRHLLSRSILERVARRVVAA